MKILFKIVPLVVIHEWIGQEANVWNVSRFFSLDFFPREYMTFLTLILMEYIIKLIIPIWYSPACGSNVKN